MALRYYALTQIFHDGVLAYAAGDFVPDSNVALYGYATDGLVEQIEVADAPGVSQSPNVATQAELDAAIAASEASARATYRAAAPALALTYDADGNVETVTETVGTTEIVTTYTYNADGTVDTASRVVDGGTPAVQTYTYVAGDLTAVA